MSGCSCIVCTRACLGIIHVLRRACLLIKTVVNGHPVLFALSQAFCIVDIFMPYVYCLFCQIVCVCVQMCIYYQCLRMICLIRFDMISVSIYVNFVLQLSCLNADDWQIST